MQLINIHTHTIAMDTKKAMVKVNADMKRCINPIFTYIDRLFKLSKNYQCEQTLNLIKKDGIWKVCGMPTSNISAN